MLSGCGCTQGSFSTVIPWIKREFTSSTRCGPGCAKVTIQPDSVSALFPEMLKC
jgi:hypothetical protein